MEVDSSPIKTTPKSHNSQTNILGIISMSSMTSEMVNKTCKQLHIRLASNYTLSFRWVRVGLLRATWLSGCLIFWWVSPPADLHTLFQILGLAMYHTGRWGYLRVQVCGWRGLPSRRRQDHIHHMYLSIYGRVYCDCVYKLVYRFINENININCK